jgi:hypothetical protein
VILGGTLLLVWARTQGRTVIWGAVFVVASALLLMGGGGTVAAAVWFAAGALFALLRWRLNLTARAGRMVALNALAALLVYLSALAVLHHFALARVAEMTLVSIAPNEQVVEIAALPTEINPLRWLAVVGTENAFYLAEILAFGSAEARFTRHPREEGSAEAIAAATRLEEAETLLRFARYPVSEARPDGRGFAVRIEDLRFGGRTGAFRLDVRLDENLQPLGIN